MSERPLLLELSNVTRTYSSVGDGVAGPSVLRGVNLRVQQGQSLAIMGPSGSGKSTLLNIISGLDGPTLGSVNWRGEDLHKQNDEQWSKWRNEQIGMVFQFHHLLPQCSALENVLIPTLATASKIARAEAVARAEKLLERMGLSARKNHRPGELSGGERQRVALVRALINQPTLILADEPTGSLDRSSAHELVELLVELNRIDGLTLIVATHSLEVASRMMRTLELRDGQLTPGGGLG